MRRNSIYNPNLSKVLLYGERGVANAHVYAQVYSVTCELQNRIIRPSDSQVDSIMDPESTYKLLPIKDIREVSLADTTTVLRRSDAFGYSGWFANRNEKMVTLALKDAVQDTTDELVDSIKISLRRRGKFVDSTDVDYRVNKVISKSNLNENTIVSTLDSELYNPNKVHASNYYSRGIDKRLKFHEIIDKAVVSERHTDLMIVPPPYRPLTMRHTSDFGYIGVGSDTASPHRNIADVERPFIIRPLGNVTLLSSDLKAVSYTDRKTLFSKIAQNIPKGKYNGLVVNVHLFQKYNGDNPITASELKEGLLKEGVSFERIDLINPDESEIMFSPNREAYERFMDRFFVDLNNSKSLSTLSVRAVIHSNYEAQKRFLKGVDHIDLNQFKYHHGKPEVIQNDFENAIIEFSSNLKHTKSSSFNYIDTDLYD